MSNELNKDFSQNLFFSHILSYLMTSGNASQTTTKKSRQHPIVCRQDSL